MTLAKWTAVLVVACACGPGARVDPAVVAPASTVTSAKSKAPAGKPPDPLHVIDGALDVVARAEVSYFDVVDQDPVYVDGQHGTLRRLDLSTGATLWETPLGMDPKQELTLRPSYGTKKRLAIYEGGGLLLVDPSSGAIVVRRQDGWFNASNRIEDRDGACLLYNDCDLRFLDCDDAHPFGPKLERSYWEFWGPGDEPPHAMCRGPRFVVGRAGSVIVGVTDGTTWDGPGATKQEGPLAVGFDASDGKTIWTSRALGGGSPHGWGISDDGATCWIADAPRVVAFVCATGKMAFEKPLADGEFDDVITVWIPKRGLFVSHAGVASLFDGKSGKAIWTTALPKHGVGLPLGAALEAPYALRFDPYVVLLLDPKSGKEIARFDLPKDAELKQSDDLGWRVVGGPAFDPAGKPRTVVEPKPIFVLDRGVQPKLLKLAETGETLAEASTDLGIVAERRDAAGDRVAFVVWGAKGEALEMIVARRPSSH